jgi:hypothetical protein
MLGLANEFLMTCFAKLKVLSQISLIGIVKDHEKIQNLLDTMQEC